jgi:hypothetical protein
MLLELFANLSLIEKMFSFFTSKTTKSAKSDSVTDRDTDLNDDTPTVFPPGSERIFAAIFYGVTSLAVIFTNKQIMTGYNFPFFDFLAAVQFFATTIILSVLVLIKKVDIPVLNYSIFREIFPISMMFLGNVICGLGSTRSLSLPMFTALRRFSILMTMFAEYFFLNNRAANPIIFSVVLMVGGAFFAAIHDMSFDAWGYSLGKLGQGLGLINDRV